MLEVLLLVIMLALYLVHWWSSSTADAKLFSKIPGPPRLPLIGNGLDFLLNQVGLFYKTRFFSNLYRDIYAVTVLDKRVINIQNPTDVETVLSSTKNNEKGFLYSFLKPWLQEGLLLSNGPKWHTRRKILTPAFHFNILRHFSHLLEENSWRMVRELESELDKSQINIVTFASTTTLHAICETAMGTRLHDISSDKASKYKEAIHALGAMQIHRLTRFWLHPSWLFNLSSVGIKQKKTLEEVRSFPSQVIDERRKYREKFGDDMLIEGSTTEDDNIYFKNNNKKRMALLDLLLSAEKDGLIDSNGIQEEVDTFMFEGHDTTSSGLCFTLLMLATHQHVQEKVVEELNSIFNGSDRPASITDQLEMKYLECCVKETLRLYPPVPFIARKLNESIQLKNYTVPAGTQCHINIFDLHRRSDLFSEPLQFRPERFLPENCLDRHPYAYIPFSAGPRNCIGQKFALLELKSAVSAILRNYKLLPITAPTDVVFNADLVLRSSAPIYMKIISRK